VPPAAPGGDAAALALGPRGGPAGDLLWQRAAALDARQQAAIRRLLTRVYDVDGPAWTPDKEPSWVSRSIPTR
jgi:hypothetical protein